MRVFRIYSIARTASYRAFRTSSLTGSEPELAALDELVDIAGNAGLAKHPQDFG